MGSVGARRRQRGCQRAPSAESLLVALHSSLPIASWAFVVRCADDGYEDATVFLPAQSYVYRVSGFEVCDVPGSYG